MNPPEDVFDAIGRPYHGPERRADVPRRDTDELPATVLLGYELWAGRVWTHRGKIAAGIGLLGSLVGCVGGYLARAHDLDDVRERLARVERTQLIQQQNESLKMSMLCSLTRRIDPLGTPPECGALQRSPP